MRVVTIDDQKITLWPVRFTQYKNAGTVDLDEDWRVAIKRCCTETDDPTWPDEYVITVSHTGFNTHRYTNVAELRHVPVAATSQTLRRRFIETYLFDVGERQNDVHLAKPFSTYRNNKNKSLRRACKIAVPYIVDVIEADSFFLFQ